MHPKSIGIVGGAGPLAGVFLLERLFTLAGKLYGCHRDADFPQVWLISFPFSEMLDGSVDHPLVQTQLSECLAKLRKNGASILAIACNTLHGFLEKEEGDLIHLPRMVAESIPPSEKPLVLCTSTSVRFGLHRRFFPCVYPEQNTQLRVDAIIDHILRGAKLSQTLTQLEKLLHQQEERTILLGCTELSLLFPHLSIPHKQIIDPLETMAQKILEKSFQS